ncbi:MAG: histidine kinase [Sulfurimonas sp. RIFCSPLOWO2_12_36_12]|uniref:HD-GYP domain-containing protein n=1 Tax=Sulfurimonas sp. RIFCSPLOWO2_12_36_12 TaxID=1802253 RepID=UPI0008C40CD0|nr:HD domain-containing phosphohydrolase [Sulfurimonas sp. RIFCSPLOWO2_12_36_12]OHE02015.1 MAG: histidine kinase [Sulfurimonas sp. RIFCSPLOWO2_12_36_12]
MEKRSIKVITVTRLLQVFIVATLVIVSIVLLSYRSFFQFIVENKIHSISEIIKAGLTSHMKAGIMDKRDYFLDEISSVHDIKTIKIIRGDAVIKEYGESTLSEKKLNNNLRAILEKKEVYVEWKDMQSSVKSVVPYIANSNCLQCHHVKEGTVLGAVDIEMKIDAYQIFVIKNSYVIIAALLLFALVVVFNMFHVIERYISRPLLGIIDETKDAYFLHKNIDSSKYESREFEDVALSVNSFNKTVIEKENELIYKNRQLQLLNEEIESTLKETMLMIGKIEEIRSSSTSRHTKRVAILSTIVAKEYGLNDEQVKLIEIASPLHDIGKVGIADAILNKPGKLTQDEYNIIKSHSLFGYNILKNSKREILKTAAAIAYEHHERYDGTGYPQGLKDEEISVYARIVAIVDVFDTLLSRRVYKEAWPIEDVIAFFKEQRGKQFEPKLVDILLENIDKYARLHRDLSI